MQAGVVAESSPAVDFCLTECDFRPRRSFAWRYSTCSTSAARGPRIRPRTDRPGPGRHPHLRPDEAPINHAGAPRDAPLLRRRLLRPVAPRPSRGGHRRNGWRGGARASIPRDASGRHSGRRRDGGSRRCVPDAGRSGRLAVARRSTGGRRARVLPRPKCAGAGGGAVPRETANRSHVADTRARWRSRPRHRSQRGGGPRGRDRQPGLGCAGGSGRPAVLHPQGVRWLSDPARRRAPAPRGARVAGRRDVRARRPWAGDALERRGRTSRRVPARAGAGLPTRHRGARADPHRAPPGHPGRLARPHATDGRAAQASPRGRTKPAGQDSSRGRRPHAALARPHGADAGGTGAEAQRRAARADGRR